MTRQTRHARTARQTPPLAARARTPETAREWAALLALTLAPLALLWTMANPLPAAATAALALAALTTARTARALADRHTSRRLTLALPWTDARLTLALTQRR